MHFEFSYLLAALLEQVCPDKLQAVAKDLLSREDWLRQIGRLEVSDCPKGKPGAITSNFPFKFSAFCRERLKNSGANGPTPEQLARDICELWQRDSQACSYFEMLLGGEGHLNARPTALFCEAFLEQLLVRGAAILFQENCIVVNVNSETLRFPPLALEPVDWQAVAQRALRADNCDIRELLSTDGARDLCAEGDRLMLLALLACPELHCRSYLLGISGSENVPWYCKRFLADAASLAALSRQLLGEGRAENGRADETARQRVETRAEKAVACLLSFRHTLRQARLTSAPELVLRDILQIIRAFYSYYNLPECRAWAARPSLSIIRLARRTAVLREVVEYALSRLSLAGG